MKIKKVTLTTTLSLLKAHGACAPGYRKLKKSLYAKWPTHKPINLLHILESNGVQDMMWCLRATEQYCLQQRYLICADMAESVLHLFTSQYPDDKRPELAIKAARKAASGKISAAYAAAYAADAAACAADAAACAADAAACAADAAACAADAAADAADAAACAADAAAYAADAANAVGAERRKQAAIIRRYLK